MKNKHQKNRGKRSRKQFGQHPVMSAAPFLHRKSVIYSDIVAVAGGDNGGALFALVNGNGLTTNSLNIDTILPQ